MDLDSYLRANGISGTEFAVLLDITEASLSRIRRGNQNISRDLIRRIVELTGGSVTLESLVFVLEHNAQADMGTTSASSDIAAEIIGAPAAINPVPAPDAAQTSGAGPTPAASCEEATGPSAVPVPRRVAPQLPGAGAADEHLTEAAG